MRSQEWGSGEFDCWSRCFVIGLVHRRGNAVAVCGEEESTTRRVSVYSQAFSGVATHESGESGVCRRNARHGTSCGDVGRGIGNAYRPPWFPRGGSQRVDRDGGGDHSVLPVGRDICGFEPRIT